MIMIDDKIISECELQLKDIFSYLEDVALYNQEKVLNAFKKNKVALRHFAGSSGYGYGDEGRDTLNSLVADVFKAEKAICTPNIVSGTHALSLCLYGVLRPNDVILSVTGEPYDTLSDIVHGKGNGELSDFGITFDSVDLVEGKIDFEGIKTKLKVKMPKMVYIQRSRGYDWRDALSIDDISKIVENVKECGFDGCIMLDNCYGEFVEKREAIEVGVNLMAGSMIKNPGGGIALTGGYVAGDAKWVDLVQNRLTSPSIGGEVGSYAYGYQLMYQGLFIAPHTVLQALKGSMLFSAVLNKYGYQTSPKHTEIPRDITLSVKLNDKDRLISFIQTIQQNSPIDSFVEVLPWEMPGYTDEVIMAAGCFVQGASIELSADAPIRPPYIAYLQGGLTYEHCKIAIKNLKL